MVMNTTTPTADVEIAAKLFRGLGDRTRLALLLALLDGERRVTDLVDQVGTSQANVSNHLSCLRECGLIAARPDGRQTFYRVATDEVETLLRAAEGLLAETGDSIELCKRYR
jgi:DNA-binding transcriptional ArsR family regulator